MIRAGWRGAFTAAFTTEPVLSTLGAPTLGFSTVRFVRAAGMRPYDRVRPGGGAAPPRTRPGVT